METQHKENQDTQGQTQQQGAPQPPQSVGRLLKTERERLALSQAQITEMTRMRTAVIEAIEKEAWGSLPPPVFVRGFLKSYAKALGLSQELVTDLYAKNAPPESPVHIPRQEPYGNRRPRAGFILLLLVVLAALYFVWVSYPSLQVGQGSREIGNKAQEASLPTEPAGKGVSVAPSQPVAATQPLVRGVETPQKQEPVQALIKPQEAPPGPKAVESPARDQASEDGWLSLTGIVKERTWLRIRIDGKEEKEYLLQPGSRPQWRGKEGFYILIGNAGGMDFDLNGKRVGNLGKPGQVIRLTLPRDAAQRERAN